MTMTKGAKATVATSLITAVASAVTAVVLQLNQPKPALAAVDPTAVHEGMEKRVSACEFKVERLEKDVERLEGQISRLWSRRREES